jgi:hypothetical protein
MSGLIDKIANSLGLGDTAGDQGPEPKGETPAAGEAGGGIGSTPDEAMRATVGASADATGGTEPIGGTSGAPTGAATGGTDPIRPDGGSPLLDASPAHGLKRPPSGEA